MKNNQNEVLETKVMVSEEVVSVVAAVEAPVEATPVMESQAEEDFGSEEDFEDVPEPKKRKTLHIVLAVAAAVILAIVLLGFGLVKYAEHQREYYNDQVLGMEDELKECFVVGVADFSAMNTFLKDAHDTPLSLVPLMEDEAVP